MKRRLNWVDLVIIAVVIVIGIGVWARLGGAVERVTAVPQEFVYQVFVQKLRAPSVEALEQSVGYPFKMDDRARQDDMGVLLDVEVMPAREELERADGTTVHAEIPQRFDVVLTLQVAGNVNDFGYFTPQLTNLGAGAEVIIASKYARVQGFIHEVLGEI